jgi:cysteine desulfurase / selenocysteine lyase
MDSFSSLRGLFPAADKWAYLDHAAVGTLCLPVHKAVSGYIDDASRNGRVNYAHWEQTIKETRERCAALLGCGPAEIALTSSTSEGANIVAKGLGFRRGDNIVVPAMEFPANLCPWQDLEQDGVTLRVVPLSSGRFPIDAILERIDGRTRLVAASSVAYHNGFRLDLETLGGELHERGVPLYVDAIQSLGALPIDVKRCRISFLSADSHKWLLGLEGAALFYCSAAMLDRIRPPFVSWRSVEEPFDFSPRKITLAPSARRFEYASYNLGGIYGFNAILKLLLETGIDRIEQRVLALTDFLESGLRNRGLEILSPRGVGEKSGIVTFRYPGEDRDYEALCVEIEKQGAVVSARGGGIRVSPHFYNNEDDLGVFLEALP